MCWLPLCRHKHRTEHRTCKNRFKWKREKPNTIQLLSLDTIHGWECVLTGRCATAQAVTECAVPLGLNSTWAPCGRVVGVEAVLNLAHAQKKYFPSFFFSPQLVCLPLTQRMLPRCRISPSLIASLSTHTTTKNPACVYSACRDWPVLAVCRPLFRCFLCCSWTLSSTRKRNETVTTQTASRCECAGLRS